MGRFAISFLYIIILLSVSVKYSIAVIPMEIQQKRFLTAQKEKDGKADSSSDDKDGKEDLKKGEYINQNTPYYMEMVSDELTYREEIFGLPLIFQKIPKLPPKGFLINETV